MFEPLPLISALELGIAWMLGWLAAAVIPLALHLLHRRRQQELPWAAMELLMQAIRQNSRTVRIEQWLLLVLRTAALILLAIALARPLLRGTAVAETILAEPPKLWLIVLDASYSMGYTHQRQSLWEAAQQRATELVRLAGPNDAFVLIELAEPSRAVISQPAFDASRVIQEIQRMPSSDEGGNLPSCLQLVQQAIDEAQQSAPEQNDVHIVFLSDLGRDTWQSAVNGAERKTLQELATRYNVSVESLAPIEPANVALTALDAESPLVLRGRELICSATVQNFSGKAIERLPVQFQSEGKTVHTEFIDCPPAGTRTVSVALQPPSVRFWNVSAIIPSDRLTIDNRRDLVISVRPQIRVVTIEESLGAARLINLSLAPGSQQNSSNAPMTVESWNIIDLQSHSLAGVDAVVLVDPSDVSASDSGKLRSFVEQGGALLVLLGPNALPATWNRESQSGGELFAFDLREVSASGDWRIDPLNYASPIAEPFANFLDAGLLTTPVFRYWSITPRESAGLLTDFAFTSGDPWIVRRSLGGGWVAAMLSAPESGAQDRGSADQPWNAIATWPSFVPIMHKSVETLVGGSEQVLNLTVGQPIRGIIHHATRSVELAVRRPDNTTSRVAVAAPENGQRQSWTYAATDRAGVYHVRAQAESDEELAIPRTYAINIAPTQSDLLSAAVSALPLGDGTKPSQSQTKALTGRTSTGQSESISRSCLVALLIVMACESLLAWNLGRRLT